MTGLITTYIRRAAFLRSAALVMAPAMLMACTSPTPGILETTMPTATLERFTYCAGYGCTQPWNMVIHQDEWARVSALFDEPAESAAEERQQIALAVGEIENIVGPKANTADDEAGATVLTLKSTRGQLDCIDESHNTTVFLNFMQRDGFFRWHTIGPVAQRGKIIDRWFHNTAVVIENETGASYVIDSWFGLNGDPADVVPLDLWMDGWHPDGFKNGVTREMIEKAASGPNAAE